MTTIYIPQAITSAEQAEALPIGTVATSSQEGGGVWRKRTADSWAKASMKPSLWTNHGIANRDAAITALVPIEAEEEGLVAVSWTDCACEWGTSYCDEYHRRGALIPRAILSAVANGWAA